MTVRRFVRLRVLRLGRGGARAQHHVDIRACSASATASEASTRRAGARPPRAAGRARAARAAFAAKIGTPELPPIRALDAAVLNARRGDDASARLSVLLPVYNAMPYLPIAVRDMLKQRLADDAPLELLVAFVLREAMTARSVSCWRWWRRSATAARATRFARRRRRFAGRAVESRPPPAAATRLRGRRPPVVRRRAAADGAAAGAARAAERRRGGGGVKGRSTALRVLPYADGASAARVRRCRSRVARARRARRADGVGRRARARGRSRGWSPRSTPHPDWDGVSCAVELVGRARERLGDGGVRRAAELARRRPEQMAAERFAEIPALHQAALFRRRAVDAALAALRTARTATARGAPSAAAPGDALDTPVDLWWWLAFFDLALRCGKLEGTAAARDLQHPAAARAHAGAPPRARPAAQGEGALPAARAGGPAHGAAQIEVWSTGETLRGSVASCRRARAADVSVRAVGGSGAPPPDGWRGRKRKAADGDAQSAAAASFSLRVRDFAAWPPARAPPPIGTPRSRSSRDGRCRARRVNARACRTSSFAAAGARSRLSDL